MKKLLIDNSETPDKVTPMKAIIKNNNSTPELKYPILMRCKDKHPKGMELVVLFIGPTMGTVIVSNVNDRQVGSYDVEWVEATDTSTWEVFQGAIELSN